MNVNGKHKKVLKGKDFIKSLKLEPIYIENNNKEPAIINIYESDKMIMSGVVEDHVSISLPGMNTEDFNIEFVADEIDVTVEVI